MRIGCAGTCWYSSDPKYWLTSQGSPLSRRDAAEPKSRQAPHPPASRGVRGGFALGGKRSDKSPDVVACRALPSSTLRVSVYFSLPPSAMAGAPVEDRKWGGKVVPRTGVNLARRSGSTLWTWFPAADASRRPVPCQHPDSPSWRLLLQAQEVEAGSQTPYLILGHVRSVPPRSCVPSVAVASHMHVRFSVTRNAASRRVISRHIKQCGGR